jgi:hypothetical protein
VGYTGWWAPYSRFIVSRSIVCFTVVGVVAVVQREKSMRGRDQTLYAGGEDVADNLRHLARKRGDVFGDDAAPAGAPGPGTAAAIKKARTDAS